MVFSAEYKDIWEVENKYTPDNELKAHFHSVRHEMKINNQLFEHFLGEAIIMKKFNHPNVLFLIGVSAHNKLPQEKLFCKCDRFISSIIFDHISNYTVPLFTDFISSWPIGILYGYCKGNGTSC